MRILDKTIKLKESENNFIVLWYSCNWTIIVLESCLHNFSRPYLLYLF